MIRSNCIFSGLSSSSGTRTGLLSVRRAVSSLVRRSETSTGILRRVRASRTRSIFRDQEGDRDRHVLGRVERVRGRDRCDTPRASSGALARSSAASSDSSGRTAMPRFSSISAKWLRWTIESAPTRRPIAGIGGPRLRGLGAAAVDVEQGGNRPGDCSSPGGGPRGPAGAGHRARRPFRAPIPRSASIARPKASRSSWISVAGSELARKFKCAPRRADRRAPRFKPPQRADQQAGDEQPGEERRHDPHQQRQQQQQPVDSRDAPLATPTRASELAVAERPAARREPASPVAADGPITRKLVVRCRAGPGS